MKAMSLLIEDETERMRSGWLRHGGRQQEMVVQDVRR